MSCFQIVDEYGYGEWVVCPGYEGEPCGGPDFGCPNCVPRTFPKQETPPKELIDDRP